MSTRREPYTCRPGFPSPVIASSRITTAVRIARMYRDRVPTVEQLKTDFGMSTATAYRWVNALRDEQEEACRH